MWCGPACPKHPVVTRCGERSIRINAPCASALFPKYCQLSRQTRRQWPLLLPGYSHRGNNPSGQFMVRVQHRINAITKAGVLAGRRPPSRLPVARDTDDGPGKCYCAAIAFGAGVGPGQSCLCRRNWLRNGSGTEPTRDQHLPPQDVNDLVNAITRGGQAGRLLPNTLTMAIAGDQVDTAVAGAQKHSTIQRRKHCFSGNPTQQPDPGRAPQQLETRLNNQTREAP